MSSPRREVLIVAFPCSGRFYILEETHLSKLQNTVFSTVLSNGKVLHEVLMFISGGKFPWKLCGKMNSNGFRLSKAHASGKKNYGCCLPINILFYKYYSLQA